jgi:hypothetical protein
MDGSVSVRQSQVDGREEPLTTQKVSHRSLDAIEEGDWNLTQANASRFWENHEIDRYQWRCPNRPVQS